MLLGHVRNTVLTARLLLNRPLPRVPRVKNGLEEALFC